MTFYRPEHDPSLETHHGWSQLFLQTQNQNRGSATGSLSAGLSTGIQTFVSLLGLPQVDLGDGFEVDVPQSDAAVSSSRGESFLTGVHAEDPRLSNMLHKNSRNRHISHQSCGFWVLPAEDQHVGFWVTSDYIL